MNDYNRSMFADCTILDRKPRTHAHALAMVAAKRKTTALALWLSLGPKHRAEAVCLLSKAGVS